MSTTLPDNYRLNYARYNYYYRQISRFYQRPMAAVSTALLLTIFTTIFFAVFAIRPTLVTIAELINTIETQKQVLEQMKRKSSSLASAQQLYNSNQAAIQALNTAFPSDKDVQGLIHQIETVAADHQLLITNFTLDTFAYEAQGDSPTTEPIPLSFSLTINGNYEAIKPFVADLSRMPRFLTFQNIILETVESQDLNQAANPEQLNISLTADAYYQVVTNVESESR